MPQARLACCGACLPTMAAQVLGGPQTETCCRAVQCMLCAHGTDLIGVCIMCWCGFILLYSGAVHFIHLGWHLALLQFRPSRRSADRCTSSQCCGHRVSCVSCVCGAQRWPQCKGGQIGLLACMPFVSGAFMYAICQCGCSS